MPSLFDHIEKRSDLLKDYFHILNDLFTRGGRGPAESFFRNKYYQEQNTKLSQEVNLDHLLDYFFRYSDDMMMNSSDFLMYLTLSRISWMLSDSVHVTKTSLKKGGAQRHLGDIQQFNRFLLRFVNVLLSMDIVYPNKKNDTENGYLQAFENIKKGIVRIFLLKVRDEAISSIASEMKLEGASRNELLSGHLEEVTDYFWKRAPALIPKTKGFSEELFVYYYLNNRRSGYYVIPLLLHQRFYSSLSEFQERVTSLKDKIQEEEEREEEEEEKNKNIKILITKFLRNYQNYDYIAVPPDFLVLRKGKMFGLECGRGKEDQIVNFSALTGVPTIFVDAFIYLGESEHGFGLKCDKCYHPFLLCDKFIEREVIGGTKFDEMPSEERTCVKICGEERAKTCPYAVITFKRRKAREILRQDKRYESYFHFICLPRGSAQMVNVEKLVPPVPFIENLDKLEIGF